MPLYEYQCGRCGRFERIRKFADAPLETCPTCGQPVEKLLSSPAIQFKGSGWYITDYARKGNGSESGKDKGEGAKADAPKSEAAKDGSSKAADSSSSSSPQSSTSKDSSASGSSPSK